MQYFLLIEIYPNQMNHIILQFPFINCFFFKNLELINLKNFQVTYLIEISNSLELLH